jgi:CO/xanthine dehydrogenase FAD-binding subunit
VKPPRLGYVAPRSLAEALEALDALGEDAKLLAGGQSLVPLLNMRLARPGWLVDLNRVAELAGVQRVAGGYSIGAMTRQRQLERDADLGRDLPILPTAVRNVGHPQIRNRGTIGGSLVHADPSAELSLLAVLLDAALDIASLRGGRRTVAGRDFFTGYLSTVLQPTELLTHIHFPTLKHGTGWGFAEVARRHGDFALVSAAATLHLDARGAIDQVRLAVGGAHAFPLRLTAAEAFLQGDQPDSGRFAEAAAIGVESLQPDGDVHASAEYRRRVAAKLLGDVLHSALRRTAVAA